MHLGSLSARRGENVGQPARQRSARGSVDPLANDLQTQMATSQTRTLDGQCRVRSGWIWGRNKVWGRNNDRQRARRSPTQDPAHQPATRTLARQDQPDADQSLETRQRRQPRQLDVRTRCRPAPETTEDEAHKPGTDEMRKQGRDSETEYTPARSGKGQRANETLGDNRVSKERKRDERTLRCAKR